MAAEETHPRSTPDRVVLLYERAVADCALHASLWLAYVAYLSERRLHTTLRQVWVCKFRRPQ